MVEMSRVAWETAAPAFSTDPGQLRSAIRRSSVYLQQIHLGPGSEYETDKHLAIPRDHSIPGNHDVVEIAP